MRLSQALRNFFGTHFVADLRGPRSGWLPAQLQRRDPLQPGVPPPRTWVLLVQDEGSTQQDSTSMAYGTVSLRG
jgi:hypothetical protein